MGLVVGRVPSQQHARCPVYGVPFGMSYGRSHVAFYLWANVLPMCMSDSNEHLEQTGCNGGEKGLLQYFSLVDVPAA
jgi:hypothetical protein